MVLFATVATATDGNGGKDDDSDTDSAGGIHANTMWFDLFYFFVLFSFILAMLTLSNSVYTRDQSRE